MTSKPVAKKKIEVSEKALVALGAKKLAGILLEMSAQTPAVEKRLRLALSAAGGADELASALSKRIGAIKRGSRFIDWNEAAAFAQELDQVRAAIANDLLPQAPRSAADLLQDFISTYSRIIERVDDSSGHLDGVYGDALVNWIDAWARVSDRDPAAFAELVMHEQSRDRYGIGRDLITLAADALGREGLLHLREKYLQRLRTRMPEPNGFDTGLFGIVDAIGQIGDALGDVDMIVEAVECTPRPTFYAAAIAERLLRHGRAAEAIAWVERGLAAGELDGATLIDLRIAALDALGDRTGAAQERWDWFSSTLSRSHFAAHVASLPEAEREAATVRAVELAWRHKSVERALEFLVGIGRSGDAERLILERHDLIDGRLYYSLRPVAERLAEDQPLGAMLLHRILCRAVLEDGRSKSYPYAVRDLIRAGELAARNADVAPYGDHDSFVQSLRRDHGRKYGFWGQLDPSAE